MVINSDSDSYRCGDTSANRASDERRSRPTASRRWCWTRSGRTGPRPTPTQAAHASGRSGRRTRRSSALTRISMKRSGSSASLDCWAGRRAGRAWRLTTALDDAHTVRARVRRWGRQQRHRSRGHRQAARSCEAVRAWRRLIIDTVESIMVAPAMRLMGVPVAAGTLAGSTSGSWASIRTQAASTTSRASDDSLRSTARTTVPTVAERTRSVARGRRWRKSCR
jgi:hypothetical protein